MSRTVWGRVYRDRSPHAAYYVQWTLGSIDRHGAHFDIVLGGFGDSAPFTGRHAVSLEFKRTTQGPAFMVIDATTRPLARHELVGRAMTREEVLGTTMAEDAFKVVDAIWLQDDRIREITG